MGADFRHTGLLQTRYGPVDPGLAYDRIFIADGCKDVLAAYKLENKVKLLHRTKALKKLGRFLTG